MAALGESMHAPAGDPGEATLPASDPARRKARLVHVASDLPPAPTHGHPTLPRPPPTIPFSPYVPLGFLSVT